MIVAFYNGLVFLFFFLDVYFLGLIMFVTSDVFCLYCEGNRTLDSLISKDHNEETLTG